MGARRLAVVAMVAATVTAACGGGGKTRSLAASTATTAADATTASDSASSSGAYGADVGPYGGSSAASSATTASPVTTKPASGQTANKTASPAPAPTGGPTPSSQSSPSTQAPATTQPPSTTTTRPPDIVISNFTFQPPTLNVSVGTTVTVKNADGVTHTWTDDAGGFDSGSLSQNQTFSHTYNKAGTFAYHCNIHQSMHGTVTVN